MKKIYLTFCLSIFCLALRAQSSLLQSGPMVGYSEMFEVKLWAQTTQAAQVYIKYWEQGKPETHWKTDEVTTQKASAFVAHLVADKVLPSKRYDYELYLNNTLVKRPYPLSFQSQTLWQWRSDAPDVRFIVGSCAYINEPEYDRPGKSYGGHYEIFDAMIKAKPEFMVWLGDNTYLREPDWNTKTGIFRRYTHTRSLPELQPFWGNVHHYATWDDHDFGPNDGDRSFWNKKTTEEAFNLFWPNLNTNVVGNGGVTNTFQWSDVQFFMLDNRYHKSPNNDKTRPRQMLGDAQIQWLLDALQSSRATFKFIAVGGQVLNDAALYENYAIYPEEKQKLLEGIQKLKISGVIFLSGDRHHSELTMLKREGTYPLYDFTCSPITAGPHGDASEPNTLRIPNSLIAERNFSVMEVSGKKDERVLTVKVLNSKGAEVWQTKINAKDLK